MQNPNLKKLLTIVLVPVILFLAVLFAIYAIGPQCQYVTEVSKYRKEKCKNRTGIQQLPYCKEHLFAKEIPDDFIRGIETWDYDLMKDARARAEERGLPLLNSVRVENFMDACGAANCEFPDCYLPIRNEALQYCPEHQIAFDIYDDFCAAIVRYDAEAIDRIYENRCGLNLLPSDERVHNAICQLIDQPVEDITELLLQLDHLSNLFCRAIQLERASFIKLQELVKAQAVDLTTLDPSQGYYAGKKDYSGNSSNGLLSSSVKRTYGYNYEVYKHSSRAAALNNAPTIESSSSVYYKDIKVAEGLGDGIWAIETPEYDFVVVGGRVCIIDNKLQEISGSVTMR